MSHAVLIVRRAVGKGREVCLFKSTAAAIAYRRRFFEPRDVLYLGTLSNACELGILTPAERADVEHRIFQALERTHA